MRSSKRLMTIATKMIITTSNGKRPIRVLHAVAPVKFKSPSLPEPGSLQLRFIWAALMKTGTRFRTIMSMTKVKTKATTLALIFSPGMVSLSHEVFEKAYNYGYEYYYHY